MATKTKRVHFGLTLTAGSGADFCCEVTKTSDPGNAAEYAVELISGDYERGDDLEAIEETAIRQAESDWAELAAESPLMHECPNCRHLGPACVCEVAQ